MDKNKLKEITTNENDIPTFIYDELGLTWQISYVRLVCGKTNNFKGIEDFYWKLMCCNKYLNQLCNLRNEPKWHNNVNTNDWIDNLKIEKVDEKLILEEIELALKEIQEEENNHEFKDRINHNIDLPKKAKKCWSIKETKVKRLFGLNWSFIAECEKTYFYIERHWES